MIKPTVGRVVHYRPIGVNGPAHAAIIACVHNDTCVNLAVFDANGSPYSRASVKLLHDDMNPSIPEGGYAEWMPYQKGQAAKTEELEKALKDKG